MSNLLKKFDLLKSLVQREFNPNETLQLLRMNRLWMMTWGARNFEQYQNKALIFTVSGRHHNGHVIITLAWNDTYTVTFVSTQWNVKDTFTDIYFDMLAETIDNRVERIADYVR